MNDSKKLFATKYCKLCYLYRIKSDLREVLGNVVDTVQEIGVIFSILPLSLSFDVHHTTSSFDRVLPLELQQRLENGLLPGCLHG